MTNQQGAPEALRTITRYEVVDCIDSKHVPAVIPNKDGPWVRYEDHLAALVEAQQPATPVQKTEEIEHVAGDVSKISTEKDMTVYAELPQSVGDHKYGGGLYTEAQLRDFADRTHVLRLQAAHKADSVLEDAARCRKAFIQVDSERRPAWR